MFTVPVLIQFLNSKVEVVELSAILLPVLDFFGYFIFLVCFKTSW